MSRTCTREGCTAELRARGLCNNHYTQWRRKTAITIVQHDTRDSVLMAMPGTIREIATTCGIKYETARKAIAKLRADGLAHVEDLIPPDDYGRHYVFIVAAGPGTDATVSKKQRREHHRLARRKWYHANAARPRNGDPLVAALFGRTKPQAEAA